MLLESFHVIAPPKSLVRDLHHPGDDPVTLLASALFLRKMSFEFGDASSFGQSLEALIFLVIVGFLIYGNLSYQATRVGYFRRVRSHVRTSRYALEGVYDRQARPLTFIVPSYKEELRIVRQTLMSAALQEYPDRRVVLLIDDPYRFDDPQALGALVATRGLPDEIQRLLDVPAGRLEGARRQFLARVDAADLCLENESRRLVELYGSVAMWLEEQAMAWRINDHTDAFFVARILQAPARMHRRRAAKMKLLPLLGSARAWRQVRREYERLASLFKVELTSFERKRFDNLSHEPNKAMNLNAYIGLIGGAYREVRDADGARLQPVDAADATLVVPHSDYLVTLDADSVLLPEYALRLVHMMEGAGNERMAVAQTPYSAIPNPTTQLERIAGATTDIQYLIHQGFTHHRATYWVGANALLRHAALMEIATEYEERGYRTKRYIQDRTVIEDTESTIDLIDKGWSLYNYPERLSYSATPADFGALVVQRSRWANGGLIILPKLLRYLVHGPRNLHKLREGFFRIHYLTSIAGVNVGLLALLTYRFPDSFQSEWLPLSALPYYFLYSRDLAFAGYRRAVDLFRVYALNLLLLPVNIGGVLRSIRQAFRDEKLPFRRTPKISRRTRTPAIYIAALYGIMAYCFLGAAIDALNARWAHAEFALVNAGLFYYAVGRFIGWRESIDDLFGKMGHTRRKLPIASTTGIGISRS